MNALITFGRFVQFVGISGRGNSMHQGMGSRNSARCAGDGGVGVAGAQRTRLHTHTQWELWGPRDECSRESLGLGKASLRR